MHNFEKTNTQKLVNLLIQRYEEGVPDEVLEVARFALKDYFASLLSAHNHPNLQKLSHALTPTTAINSGFLVDSIDGKLFSSSESALYNGFQAHLLDIDDVQDDLRGHPSSVIFSAVIGQLSHGQLFTIKETLTAYAIANEVEAVFGTLLNPQAYEHGYHMTMTLGGIGATVALGLLKGLPELEFSQALGVAATQAAGWRLQFGSDVKPFHVGLAARQAVESINFVTYGLTGNDDAIFDHNGLGKMLGKNFSYESFTKLFGHWFMVHPGMWFKQYGYCSAASRAVDAATYIHDENQIKEENIEKVSISFQSGRDSALRYVIPKNKLEAKFSAEYLVWRALTGRSLNIEDGPIESDIAQRLSIFQRVIHKNDIGPLNSIVTVTMKSKIVYQKQIFNPKGSPQNPLSCNDLIRKSGVSLQATFDLIDDDYVSLLGVLENLHQK